MIRFMSSPPASAELVLCLLSPLSATFMGAINVWMLAAYGDTN
jgi:hypothetical protein